MSETIALSLTVNGERVDRDAVRADMLLIDFLHEELGLTGTKFSCGVGACGACKVALEETEGAPMIPVLACFARLSSVNGTRITTVEGLADNDEPNPLQRAFLEEHAFQCGWSTPGFLMAGTVLLDRLAREPVARADLDAVIVEAIGGNICRCTGYLRYFRAIKRVILDTPGLVRDAPPATVTRVRPTVSFAVTKRSGNDLRDKLVIGSFEASDGSVVFAGDLGLDGCRADVSVVVASLATGERVRDLNLRRFFFSGDSIDFALASAKLVDRRVSLDTSPWGTPVPVTLAGKLSLGAVLLDVEHGVLVRVLSSQRLRVTSRAPLSLDMRALGLPVEAFAAEFGLVTLNRDVEVTLDLELPYRLE